MSSHVLFATSGSSTHSDIYSMNPDGTGRKAVVVTQGDEYDPAWSPNYTRLVFSRSHNAMGALNGLWTIGWDGSQEFRVTDDYRDRGPKWGKTNRIAFDSTRETMASFTNEIFTINPDGTGVTRLTYNAAEDQNPAWSPDGSRIVFASDRAGRGRGAIHLYVMNADGTGLKQLTFGKGEDQPTWSPDGTQIAYSIYGGFQTTGLWVMNADGTSAKQLLSGLAPGPGGVQVFFLGQPSWSPDSKRIAFTSDWSGEYEIYSIGVAGGGMLKLTALGQAQMPAWSY